MITISKWLCGVSLLGLLVGCQTAGPVNSSAQRTALDRYVAAPDSSYQWKVAESTAVPGGRVSMIDLTSQTWLTTNEVNRTQWKHWLVVARPDDLKHTTALLFISGGNNRSDRPPKPSQELLAIAKSTRSVVAELRMVPNQPLIFGNDGKERVEDDLIAYTWDKYLRTGDERWPARLPMTKAAVRAMDAITAFCSSDAGGKSRVDTFVVAGGSKRGWTTWTTAAVDKRVVAICPIVIDVLNLEPSMVHHHRAYGFFAPAIDDYTTHGIMNWIGTPEMKALMAIEEPFSYRDRYTMPKLLLNACGDQFFLPDSSQFYARELPGKTCLRYVPNADHSLKGSDAYETLAAWHHAMLHHTVLPEFSWAHDSEGQLTVTTRGTSQPLQVRLWQATNPKARDFRIETLGAVWKSEELRAETPGLFRARITKPDVGWTAYLVELTYDVGAPTKLKLTTDVRVIPELTPFAAPRGLAPQGFLSR